MNTTGMTENQEQKAVQMKTDRVGRIVEEENTSGKWVHVEDQDDEPQEPDVSFIPQGHMDDLSAVLSDLEKKTADLIQQKQTELEAAQKEKADCAAKLKEAEADKEKAVSAGSQKQYNSAESSVKFYRQRLSFLDAQIRQKTSVQKIPAEDFRQMYSQAMSADIQARKEQLLKLKDLLPRMAQIIADYDAVRVDVQKVYNNLNVLYQRKIQTLTGDANDPLMASAENDVKKCIDACKGSITRVLLLHDLSVN